MSVEVLICRTLFHISTCRWWRAMSWSSPGITSAGVLLVAAVLPRDRMTARERIDPSVHASGRTVA